MIVLAFLLVLGCAENLYAEQKTPDSDVPVPDNRSTAEKEILPLAPDNDTINYCHDYCSLVHGGENDKVEYNQSNGLFFCSCSDFQGYLAAKTEMTGRDLELYSKKKVWWPELPVTYKIMNPDECGSYEANKIRKAFARIEEESDKAVIFRETENSSADIELTCAYIKDCYKKKIDIRREEGVIYKYESICSHAAGFAEITETEGFKLKKAEITIVGLDGFAETTGMGMSGFYIGGCGHPTVEMHEILHTFGFGHSDDPDSIMYYSTELVPYTIQKEGACIGSDIPLGRDIVEELKFVYRKR